MKLTGPLAAVCGAALSTSAMAAPILWISDSEGNLVKVDVSTGNSTVVGNSGVVLTDIAFDPTGNLYGISFNTLFSVNSVTAQATPVGSLGIFGMNALVFGTDGTLYAAATNTTNLYTVNTMTGLATIAGSTGFFSAGDLAFVGNDLFLSANTSPSNSLVSIDLSPVSGISVGLMGINNVFGMARAEDNVLYGVSGNSIYSINTNTGGSTFLNSYNYVNRGLAFGTSFFLEAQNPGAVPEPETWYLLLLGFGLVGASLRWRNLRVSLRRAAPLGAGA